MRTTAWDVSQTYEKNIEKTKKLEQFALLLSEL